MTQEDDNIDVISDEQNDYYSDDDLYNITSWGADLSFRELITQYEDGDLLKPELQRNYVWDKAEASRFIDSLLLGLPVPSIFLAKTNDQRMLIIDGYQRIMTVYDYVRGIFSGDEKVFRLSRSNKVNPRWRGKAFSELPDTEQRKIRTTTIHCIIFVQRAPKDDDTSMYQVFERINTSGRSLMPQEIRNCVYQGQFNNLLIELNSFTSWRKLYGLEKPDSRMRDMEFILRYFALGTEQILFGDNSGQISLKKHLNEYMGSKESQSQEILKQRRNNFIVAVEFVLAQFGVEAFHNISSKEPDKLVKKFNPTIFDSIMIATNMAVNQNISRIPIDNGKQRRLELLRDEEFQDLIRVRTTSIDRIRQRISKAASYLYGIAYE